VNSSPAKPAGNVNDPRLVNEEALVKAVIRLSCNALGLTLGILMAAGIFAATNFLVLKGGPHVGAHLQLLNQFFPGYKVTMLGSLVGAGYAFVLGYISGWIVAAVYNAVVSFRRR
jgi:hypothetical protein